MAFYEKHSRERDRFEIVAFHEESVPSFRELDQKLAPIIQGVWKGKSLPFPILLDATGQTLGTNYAIQAFPTTILIDPEGKLVPCSAEALLEDVLQAGQERGHPVALSPDGRWLAASASNEVRILSFATGQSQLTLQGHSDTVNALAFSPDNRTLASAGRDKTIRLWDITSGKNHRTLKGHESTVFSLAFAPDGQTLASAGFDTVRLWDARSGKRKDALAPYRFPAWSVAFSPDGRTVAAGGVSMVRLWETTSGRETGALRSSHQAPCWSIAFSPDGQTLAATEPAGIALWDPATGRRRAGVTDNGSQIVRLDFEDEGRILRSITRGKTVRFWDLAQTNAAAAVPKDRSERAARWLEQMPDDARAMNAECRGAVLRPGGTAADYARALAQARAACRLEPTNSLYQQDLGIALYRTAQYAEAIRVLDQSASRTLAPPAARTLPPSLCFLAMARHRSGDSNGAALAVAQARGLMLNRGSFLENFRKEMELEIFGPQADEARAFLESRLEQARQAAPSSGSGQAPAEARVGSIQAAELADDSSVTAELRATAVRLAPFVDAERLVVALRVRLVLSSRVRNGIAAESARLSPAARRFASIMASELEDNAAALNLASWEIVAKSGAAPVDYALALEQAETAVRLDPNPNHLDTLGVAQYRAGNYEEAIATLRRSQSANSQGANDAADVAFLAMSSQKLGRLKEARKYLNQLRENAKSFADDPRAVSFVQEAETLLGTVADSGTGRSGR